MAGKSLGTLTLDVVADTGNLQVGLRKAGETMTAFQKRLNTITTGQDAAYQGAMSRMSNYYAKLEKTSEKAVNKLVAHSNTLAGIENQRKIALENLNKVFHESERSTDAYRVALEGIEASYAMGVNRVNAYNKVLGMTGDKTRLARHEMLNLSYQLNDVFVGFMSGQRPMTIFAQQGAQIGQIAVASGVGVKGLAVALASMAKSAALAAGAFLLNPYVLSFTAVVGGATIAVKSFTNSVNESAGLDDFIDSLQLTTEQTEDLEEALKDLGGTTVGVGDILKAFIRESGLKKDMQDLGDIAEDVGASFMDFGKGIAEYATNTFFAATSLSETIAQVLGGGADAQDFMRQWDQNWADGINGLKGFGKDVEKEAKNIRESLINNALVGVLAPDYHEALKAVRSEEEKITEEYNKRVSAIRKYAAAAGLDDWVLREQISKQTLKYEEDLRKLREKENKDLEKRSDYIRKINLELDNQIERSGILTEEREKMARLDKYAEQMTGKGWAALSSSEKTQLETKVNLLSEIQKKQSIIDSAYQGSSKKALENYNLQQAALLSAKQRMLITEQEYISLLYDAEQTYLNISDATYSYQKSLDETVRTFGVFGDELLVMQALTEKVMSGLEDGQADAISETIRHEAALARVNNELGKLWTDNAGKMQIYAAQIDALNKALRDGDITEGFNEIARMDITASATQSRFAGAGAGSVYAETQGRIDAIAKKQAEWNNALEEGLVTQYQYNNAVGSLNVEMLQLQALQGNMSPFEAWSSGLAKYASDYKGVMAELQDIGANFFSTWASGAADAFTRSIMYGDSFKDSMYDLAQNALQMVISQLVQMAIQAMIVRAIMGFGTAGFGSAGANSITGAVGAGFGPGLATGGYTGNLPRDKAVNYVHGQEFVVNANATARNRALLESINAGKPVSADMIQGGAKPTINIHNYAGAEVQTRETSTGDIEVIIDRKLSKELDDRVAAFMSKPNSRSRKALAETTNVQPRR